MNSTRAFHSPGQPLRGFYTAVWALISLLCTVVACWSGSRTPLQCSTSGFVLNTAAVLGCLQGSSTFWGCCSPMEAKDMALIWPPGLSSHPSYKELSSAVLCSAGSWYKYVRPLNCRLAPSLHVSGPEQDENSTLFSPSISLIMKYMGRSLWNLWKKHFLLSPRSNFPIFWI